jgi:hypothetical protein
MNYQNQGKSPLICMRLHLQIEKYYQEGNKKYAYIKTFAQCNTMLIL